MGYNTRSSNQNREPNPTLHEQVGDYLAPKLWYEQERKSAWTAQLTSGASSNEAGGALQIIAEEVTLFNQLVVAEYEKRKQANLPDQEIMESAMIKLRTVYPAPESQIAALNAMQESINKGGESVLPLLRMLGADIVAARAEAESAATKVKCLEGVVLDDDPKFDEADEQVSVGKSALQLLGSLSVTERPRELAFIQGATKLRVGELRKQRNLTTRGAARHEARQAQIRLHQLEALMEKVHALR